MTQKETGFKIVKFKGKAISVAICALFGGSVSSVAFAADTTVASGSVAISSGNTPVFTGSSGTATVASGQVLVGNATTVTSGVGDITIADNTTNSLCYIAKTPATKNTSWL